MLGLPVATELHKQIAKNLLYTRCGLNTAEQNVINRDISKITIVHEISPARVHIAEGTKVTAVFVLLIHLKRKDFLEKAIISVSKMIPQNLVMVLEYEGEACLGVYYKKLYVTCWQKTENLVLRLQGLDFDALWDNIITQIIGITIEPGNTLDEQIALYEQRQKLTKEIEKLEKRIQAENQPKKKFALVQEKKELERKLELSQEAHNDDDL